MNEEFCDYCGAPDARKMRPIGFDKIEGVRTPVIRLWCGDCEPDDECDQEAFLAVLRAVHS